MYILYTLVQFSHLVVSNSANPWTIAGEATWTWQVAWRTRTDSREQESSCERHVGCIHGARLTNSLWDCTWILRLETNTMFRRTCVQACVSASGSACTCVIVHVCLCVCEQAQMWVCLCTSVWVHCVCVCMRTCICHCECHMCVWIVRLCTCESVYVWMCICMRVCGGGRLTRECVCWVFMSLWVLCVWRVHAWLCLLESVCA